MVAQKQGPPGEAGRESAWRSGISNTNYNTRRKLPPYAKHIIHGTRFPGTSADGSRHSFWLVIGADAWNLAREFHDQGRAVTLLPPGDDPTRYRWDFLRGHDPVLLVRAGLMDTEWVRPLIEAVIADGVGRVLDLGTLDRYLREGSCLTL